MISISSLTAYADAAEYKDINITAQELTVNSESGEQIVDAAPVIEKYLNDAKENATDGYIYRIYIPEGSYNFYSALHIYSNTYLYLTDKTTLTQNAGKGTNLIISGNGEVYDGYNGCKNILIKGGIWDMKYNGSCAMRFGHCSGVTVTDARITNIQNAHHIEIAAADGFSITNCTFENSTRTDSSCEAVQIDILHDDVHFPGYANYDDTPCRNVTVSSCTFKNLYSGIGTRSGVVGSYFTNISITKNTFENIKEKAISCFNYKNSTVSDNVMNGVTSGIVFEYLPNSAVSNRMFMPNSSALQTEINANSSSVINSNVINVSNTNSGTYSCGIYAYGSELDNTQANNENVRQGSYFIKNLKISSNYINCYLPNARGIFVTGVNNSEISHNTLTDYTAAVDGINAINICGSKKNEVSGNVISGGFNNGISLYSDEDIASKSTSLSANSINGVLSYGVRIASGSSASIKNDNIISNCGKSTLCILSKNYSQSFSAPIVKSTSLSNRGKPLVRMKALDSEATGYKVSRAVAGGSLRQLATVKNSNLLYTDTSARAYNTYYYRFTPYKNVSGTVIIGTNYTDISVSC